MNRPVHAAAPSEPAVGGVHDRVDLLRGDVAEYQFQRSSLKWDFHGQILQHFRQLFLAPMAQNRPQFPILAILAVAGVIVSIVRCRPMNYA
jgi:hypothetical protein